MPSEPRRGCDYRKVGSLYLCGSGITRHCDIMDIELLPCPTCGFDIPFTRNLMRIKKQWMINQAVIHHGLLTNAGSECYCLTHYPNCALCFPEQYDQDDYGLMWVGKRHYSVDSFRVEAESMGVSKKIPDVPTWLTLGKTMVLLAHKEVPFLKGSFGTNGLAKSEPRKAAAIFYAFLAQTVEMPIWKSQATPDYMEQLEKQGITPVIIPDGDIAHAPGPKKYKEEIPFGEGT